MPTPALPILILQHPREAGEVRGTAELLAELTPRAKIARGLSWPNFRAALERAELEVSEADAVPARWWVLYLGSADRAAVPGGDRTAEAKTTTLWVQPKPKTEFSPAALMGSPPAGLIVLDGTWTQAKSLWWRNSWLLKHPRAFLAHPPRSLYAEVRREPRAGCVSTLETAAYALGALGVASAEWEPWLEAMRVHVAELRSVKAPAKKPDWRRRPDKSRRRKPR